MKTFDMTAPLEWVEARPGYWITEGYMILEEREFSPTLEEWLVNRPVFSWKADGWLFKDMRTESSLADAKAAVQSNYSATQSNGDHE